MKANLDGINEERGILQMKLFKVIGFVISVVVRSLLSPSLRMGGAY